MNKSLILVSRKPIVIQIFTLVCKKLNIKLDVLNEVQIDHKVDIIVIDNDFIDDRFDIIKSYSKIIGAISKEELPFGSANDFIIPLPFLPSSLEQILETQLTILQKRNNSKTYISNVEVEEIQREELPEIVEPAVEYLESLADDIAFDMEEENDDSIVALTALNNGGILDTKELSNIQNIMTSSKNVIKDDFDSEKNEDEWMDLSSIIDQAIDEVNTVSEIYSKFDNKPIKVLLNNYELEELTPLLNKLDQDIIDSLTDGYEINLQIKLGQTEGE
ncbi:hypothetical protein OAR97_06220 [Arcobacteraceae bacterium]|nr:hypothetical protein [Arcobacteraceae bacterium]